MESPRPFEWYVACLPSTRMEFSMKDRRPTFYESTSGTSRSSDLERWAGLAAATGLVAYGLSRRTVRSRWLAAAAAPFAYRVVAGHWPRFVNGRPDERATTTALAGNRGVDVREAIRLEKPVTEVYRFWRRLENLPQFMSHLERVTELDDRRSHWTARGPAGMRVEWDAEIINEVPDKVIGWRSLADSDVVNAGSVNFDTVRAGRSTQVTVRLQYAPPAGRAGAFVATIFAQEPSQTIREDLRRLKQILEAGEIPRTAADQLEGHQS
jgi:uncharacterized membrane protein